MIRNLEGTRIPEATFRTRRDAGWYDLGTAEVFAGKTVVVFALPGAFTPTCSASHVPRYDELFEALHAQGVDEVYCLSVNDAFVMDAWAEAQGVRHVKMLPDGNGTFTAALGLLVDKRNLGFGDRAWRCSLLVKDGEIVKHFIEQEVPGDPFSVSDADSMLAYLGGTAPPEIVIFSRVLCSWCHKARKLLDARGLKYVDVPTTPGMLRAVSGRTTTPQVFIDGKHIGGYEDLEKHLAG